MSKSVEIDTEDWVEDFKKDWGMWLSLESFSFGISVIIFAILLLLAKYLFTQISLDWLFLLLFFFWLLIYVKSHFLKINTSLFFFKYILVLIIYFKL